MGVIYITTILVLGEKSDDRIENYIRDLLTSTYKITYVKNDKIWNGGKGYELLVIDTDTIREYNLDECIIIMKNGGTVPNISFPENSIIVANSENINQLNTLKTLKQNVITCGNCKLDTLSFTSFSGESMVISLNRRITALSGKKIEPLEFPVNFHGEHVYDIIAFTALRLVLDDYNSEIGTLY